MGLTTQLAAMTPKEKEVCNTDVAPGRSWFKVAVPKFNI